MGVGSSGVIRALHQCDAADGGDDPICSEGSYFANGVVGLIADVEISVLVEGDIRREIERCL